MKHALYVSETRNGVTAGVPVLIPRSFRRLQAESVGLMIGIAGVATAKATGRKPVREGKFVILDYAACFPWQGYCQCSLKMLCSLRSKR